MSMKRRITRRQALQTGAATAALPLARIHAATAGANRVLRYTFMGDIPALDPHWTSSGAVSVHAFAAFDMLFGMTGDYQASPQMVEGHKVEADGKRWTLTLREGLKFHDGEPVLARDCAASIRRWGQRNPFGQALLAATDDVSAADDRKIAFRLKKPFPRLPDALGTTTPPIPAMMPERLAKTEAVKQVTEIIGSGPYRFKADERVAGHRTVYERFPEYRPRQGGTPDWTAGPKIVHFDRVEWTVIPDSSTQAAALQKGEVDWWGFVDPDLLPLLRRDNAIRISVVDPLGALQGMRMNHLQPPFNNPSIRRALLGAVNQQDHVIAVAGTDSSLWRTGIGIFPPGSPMASSAGLDALTGPRDMDEVRREIVKAGYNDERVVIIVAADTPQFKRSSDVGADMLKQAGLSVDYQLLDRGTFAQRQFNKEPVDKGGWSCYFGGWWGSDVLNPAVHGHVRGNGTNGRPGWPTSQRLEDLREAWIDASDLTTQQRIAAEIQAQVLTDVTFIPLGLVYNYSAYRADLTGVLAGPPSLFWHVRRQG